ncbi:MAG TPA: glycosyltransferase family 39 protein [Thermomicrobiales bacterium]|jgi:4-amino-4-deoxy-L-arabinose transferase-like glycosyltransferase
MAGQRAAPVRQRPIATAPKLTTPPSPFLRAEALVLLALIVAAALRFTNLGGLPPGLNQDEAVSGYDAYSLLRTGRDHHGHPLSLAGLESFGDWASPLLTFLTIPAIALFGLKVETLRLVSATIGVLVVPLLYWLGRELFGQQRLGVAAAWIIALSPAHTSLSRWAIPPTLVPTFVTLTLLAVVWAIRRRSDRGIVVACIAAALTILAYPTMKLYVPLLGLATVIVYWRTLLHFRREALAYGAIALVLLAGPTYYLSTRDPGGRARLAQESIFSQANLQVDAPFLARQYFSYFSPSYLFAPGYGDQMHLPGRFGVDPRALAPLLLLGLLALIFGVMRRNGEEAKWFPWLQRQPAALLLLAIICYPIPGSLTRPAPHLLRGAQYFPLAALCAAIGIAVLSEGVARLIAGRQQALMRVALATLLLVPALPEVVTRQRYYFTAYGDSVVWHYQYGLHEALEFAIAQQARYDEIWIDRTNQPYIYVLFYTRADPSAVHTGLQVRRQPPYFNSVGAFGKYRFGDPANGGQMALPVLYTIARPTGQIRYEVRGGVYNNRRILLIRKP